MQATEGQSGGDEAPAEDEEEETVDEEGKPPATEVTGFESLALLEGRLSPRVLGLVMEWAAMHQQELLEDWNLARQYAPLKPIQRLE